MKLKFNALNEYHIDPFYLSVFRVVYCLIIFCFLGLPSYTWISSMPDYLYRPPVVSLAKLFHSFPSDGFLLTLTIINLVSFMTMFLGIKTKWSSIVFTVTALIGHSFWYSFGKIDHMILWYIIPGFLCFAGWGNYLSFNQSAKKEQPNNALIIFMFALTIAFSMFTSGVQKLEGGWLNWEGEAVRFHLIQNYLILDRNQYLAEFFLNFKPHAVWKFFDYSALFLEIGFIFSLVRLKYFRAFLFMAVLFHFMILLMYNIAFYSNIIAYLLFVNWPKFFSLWKNQMSGFNEHYAKRIYTFMVVTAGIFSIYWLAIIFFNTPVFFLPGLMESLCKMLAIQASFQTSMLVMFILSIAFVAYLFYTQTTTFLSERKGIRSDL